MYVSMGSFGLKIDAINKKSNLVKDTTEYMQSCSFRMQVCMAWFTALLLLICMLIHQWHWITMESRTLIVLLSAFIWQVIKVDHIDNEMPSQNAMVYTNVLHLPMGFAKGQAAGVIGLFLHFSEVISCLWRKFQ